jgi:hypothetical protein
MNGAYAGSTSRIRRPRGILETPVTAQEIRRATANIVPVVSEVELDLAG